MLQRSLTAKILIAIGLTVAVVIAVYTYFVIRVQSQWWHERSRAQTVINASLIHEYLNGVMLSDRHQEVQKFLENLHDSGEISRGRIIKPDGAVVFSTQTQEVGCATVTVPKELFGDDRIVQGDRVDDGQRYDIVMRPVENIVSCRRCHGDTKQIGAIVVERSLAPAEANIASNRNLLIMYGLLMFLLVSVVLWLLIVRLITQPVGDLLQNMRQVQAGNLNTHAEVASRDEVGELAAGFNAMVESLDRAQLELQQSHEKQIQQADKLASIGELSASIAHEIRNPLAGISAAVEVLSESHTSNGATGEVVTEIRHQINRLNNTLRDLLDFARQREPEIVPCDVANIIRPMLALVRPDAHKQHITITESIADNLPPVCADLAQLQQAVLNILLNAVQAMPEGGDLTVTAAHLADTRRVAVQIRDTGSGISAELQAKIFSPFFTTKHRGTGLGLAITRNIIEKHGGRIRVESKPGAGAVFTLELAPCTESAIQQFNPRN